MAENDTKERAKTPETRRDKVVRWALQIGAVVIVFMAVAAWQTRGAARGEAPGLMARGLDGEVFDLNALRGEPVLVHFWATWCGVCHTMEGGIRDYAADHRTVRVATRSGRVGNVQAWLASQERSEDAVARDDETIVVDESDRIANIWGVRAYPTTFWVDAEGQIRHVAVGFRSGLMLRGRSFLTSL